MTKQEDIRKEHLHAAMEHIRECLPFARTTDRGEVMKGEEIRGGIAKLCANGMRDCNYECESCVELNRVLKDVMIEVDRELPKPPQEPFVKIGDDSGWGRFRAGAPEEIWKMALEAAKEAGYGAFEPLIQVVDKLSEEEK